MNLVSPVKREVEVIPLTVDLSDVTTSTITGASIDVTVFSGEDSDPNHMVYETPVIRGKTVTQRIQAGIPGNIYTVRFVITTADDSMYEQSGYVAVLPNGVPGDAIYTTFYRTSLVYPVVISDGIGSSLYLSNAGDYRVGLDGMTLSLGLLEASMYGVLSSYTSTPDGLSSNLSLVSATLAQVLVSYAGTEDGMSSSLSMISAAMTPVGYIQYTTGRPEGLSNTLTLLSGDMYVP